MEKKNETRTSQKRKKKNKNKNPKRERKRTRADLARADLLCQSGNMIKIRGVKNEKEKRAGKPFFSFGSVMWPTGKTDIPQSFLSFFL